MRWCSLGAGGGRAGGDGFCAVRGVSLILASIIIEVFVSGVCRSNREVVKWKRIKAQTYVLESAMQFLAFGY